MKANKFVEYHGLQYTRNLVRDYPNHTHVTDDGRMFINENTCVSHIKVQLNELVKMDDLKRLVENHELVEKCGGIESLKSWLNYEKRKIDLSVYFHCNKPPVLLNIETAEKAIADVESCQ